MKKLNEYDIVQSYINKPFDIEKLLTISYKNGDNGNRYISDCYNFKKDLLDLFKITPTLLERWGYYGIEFSIYIFSEDGKISNCYISKYKNTYINIITYFNRLC